jgi:hypothetical protein
MTTKSDGRIVRAATTRRRLALRMALKIVSVALIDFVLLRIWGPDLINLHRDWALALGLACFAAAFALIAWLAFQLWTDRSRWVRTEPSPALRGPDMEI